MAKLPDIDIDVANREQVLESIQHVPASLANSRPHISGIYVQNIPQDLKGQAVFDYERAEELGYFKIDVLNNSVYQAIASREQRDRLLAQEPNWNLLLEPAIVEQLPHVREYVHILKQHRPQSVEQLAAVLAMIRPGKRHLVGQSWDRVMAEVWTKPHDNSYYFKRSHSISYALLVILKLNLITEQLVINSAD